VLIKKIFCISWNLKDHYWVHKHLVTITTPNQKKQLYILPYYFEDTFNFKITFDITGFSSSLSIGMEVLCTQVFVQRWCNRTYELCGTRESPLVCVVASNSNRDAISFECGTETR
jgi:hypothetical protein